MKLKGEGRGKLWNDKAISAPDRSKIKWKRVAGYAAYAL